MNEPIDNLIENIHSYSRPASSNPIANFRDHKSNRYLKIRHQKGISMKVRKERALTAQVKKGS